jgi:AcrR family transcriptional regulator
MDEIAKLADVSKGTLYLYFTSKEELFYSICKYAEKSLVENTTPLFKDKKNLDGDLGEFFDSYGTETKDTEKVWFEAISESMRNPRLKQMIGRHKLGVEQYITEFLKQMKSKGGFFKNDVDLHALAIGMIALYNGLTMNRIVGKSDSENKDVWIKTMNAIFFGTGN